MPTQKTLSLLSLVALSVIATFAFLFTYDREWIGDDLVYQYVCGPDDAPLEKIESGADVMRSQMYHVMHINGRLPVHVIVQYFAGIFGQLSFAIANTLMFVVLVLLIQRLCYGTFSIQNPVRLLILGCILLFGFPNGVWYALAMGLNYLWVGVLYAIFILVFFERGEIKPRCLWGCVLLSFILGWTNEAFSVPLSATIFLIWVLKVKKMQSWHIAMTCALWIGTALVVFAPGTISRVADSETNSITNMMATLINCYSDIWIFWLTCAAFLIFAVCSKAKLKPFITENKYILFLLVASIVFSIYAHTYSHSLTCVELLSLVLLIKLWRTCDFNRYVSKSFQYLVVFALVIFGGAIACCNHKSVQSYRNTLKDYSLSPDGVFRLYANATTNKYLRIFCNDYKREVTPSYYTARHIMQSYGHDGLWPIMLSENDFNNVIEEPDRFFIEKNRVPGSAHAYDGDWYYFIRCEKGDDESQYIAYFDSPDFTQNMSFVRRLVYKFVLNNKKAPKPLEAEVIHTRAGDYVILKKLLSVPSRIDVND